MDYTQGIKIDGIAFDVPLVSMQRTFDKLNKFAERNEDNGDLETEVLGVYLNYTMQFGIIDDAILYQALIDKLTEPTEFHDFEMPHTTGTFKFRGYIDKVTDTAYLIKNNEVTFQDLSCQLIMKTPFRKP